MRTSVLATVRAFSSQRRRAAGCRAGCRAGIPRARTHPTEIAARIQADLRIQIVHALSQLDSCTRGWMGGRACDGTVWSRLPGRGAPPNSFEKSADRKLKCARRLRSLASALARARGSEASQFYWGARGVRKS